ncbi:MAG: SLC13/DASS family transporter [Nitrospinae bacterium]|nr:SLC13/DASS family transporter [Nitrospinota bacterium]
MRGRDKIVFATGALILLAAGLDLFHPLFGLDDAQEASLATLLIAALLWVTEAVPLFATAFVILFLQATLLLPALEAGGHPLPLQAILTPFFSNIILLFLGGFVLSAALHRFHLDQRLAHWLLARVKGNPNRLLLIMIGVSGFLSMWMSNTATTAMMFAIAAPIIMSLEGAPFARGLALSIPFACNLGGMGTPIGTPPNAIVLSYLAKAGTPLSFLTWMVMAVPVVLIALFFLWRLLLALYPADGVVVDCPMEEKGPLTGQGWFVLGVFVLTCVGWMTSDLHGYPTGVVALVPLVLFFGLRLLSTQDFRTLSWDVLFMLGGGLTLGVGLEASGLAAKIVGAIPEETSVSMVIVSFAVLTAVMATFFSHTATANLVIPIAVSLGAETAALAVIVGLASSTAMALPISTPPNAIAYGSGAFTGKDMLKTGLLVTVAVLALILIAGRLYWRPLGLV